MLGWSLKNRLSAWVEREKLKRVVFKQRSMTKEVHNCEPEHGSFLGEEDDEYIEERIVESLMYCWESPYQHIRKIS
jgi:hypothetical protein